MKSLLFLCSLVLLCNAPSKTNIQAQSNPTVAYDYNPFIKLAEIKNSMDMSVDDYVNTIVERVNVDPSKVINKAKEKDSWLFKSFIRDTKYMNRMHKIHVEINKHFDPAVLESQEFYAELKAEYPYYAELLPIISSPGDYDR